MGVPKFTADVSVYRSLVAYVGVYRSDVAYVSPAHASDITALPPTAINVEKTLGCGREGNRCCQPPVPVDSSLYGPLVACDRGLGCDIVTNRCVAGCGDVGQPCCDGPETKAIQWTETGAVRSPTGFGLKEMCRSGACDKATHRCIACGMTPGAPCCPPDAAQTTFRCVGDNLECDTVFGGLSRCFCELGFTDCHGLCKDLQTDPENCGACGKQCPRDWSCCGGVCTACPQGGVCSGAQCVCPPGLTDCGGVCTKCPQGGMCSGTQCDCPKWWTNCGGFCKYLWTDSANCGGCGRPCQTVCSGGICWPPQPISLPPRSMGGGGGGGGGATDGGGGSYFYFCEICPGFYQGTITEQAPDWSTAATNANAKLPKGCFLESGRCA